MVDLPCDRGCAFTINAVGTQTAYLQLDECRACFHGIVDRLVESVTRKVDLPRREGILSLRLSLLIWP